MNDLPLKNILTRLQELTQGLSYLSESDYPVEVIQFTAPDTHELNPEAVLSFVQQPSGTKVEVKDLPHFFRNVTKPVNGVEAINSLANRYRALEIFLQEHLTDIKVYRIGKRNIQVYVLGKLEGATYVGIKTMVAQSD